jgi:hypothetical protein
MKYKAARIERNTSSPSDVRNTTTHEILTTSLISRARAHISGELSMEKTVEICLMSEYGYSLTKFRAGLNGCESSWLLLLQKPHATALFRTEDLPKW